MKKRSIFLFFLLVFFLTACQATPEADIVVQKNTEQMIEAALATPGSTAAQAPEAEPGKSALYAALGIPEVYQATLTSATGKLTVYVDVRPRVPEVDVLPVARVVPANFSQETVTALYDYLIGDTPMFERTYESDKIMIEERILEYQRLLSDPTYTRSYDFFRESIENLTKAYPTAPDKLTPVPADATLKSENVSYEETDVLDGVRTKLDIVSDIYGKGMSLTVFNNTRYEREGCYFYVDEQGNTQGFTQQSRAKLEYVRNQKEYNLRPSSADVRADVTELSLTGGLPEGALLTVTPASARVQAQALLDAIGADDMAIESVLLMSTVYRDMPMWLATGFRSEQEWFDAGSPNPFDKERQGYAVVCLRSFNGVCVASDLDQTSADGTMSSATWYNEKLYICVNDEGICGLEWEAPLAVTEVVTENAAVKPFREIQEIIEKMMFVVYEPYVRKCTIASVRLSLQRISEQDSFTSGILAPVWNIYGYESRLMENGEWDDVPLGPWPLLTVNAIDGSVIDIYKGY